MAFSIAQMRPTAHLTVITGITTHVMSVPRLALMGFNIVQLHPTVHPTVTFGTTTHVMSVLRLARMAFNIVRLPVLVPRMDIIGLTMRAR